MIPEAKELTDYILVEAANIFSTSEAELLGRSKKGAVMARHAFHYELAKWVNAKGFASLSEVGKLIGGKHYSTIIYSRDLIERIVRKPHSFSEKVIAQTITELDGHIQVKAQEMLDRLKISRAPSLTERVDALESWMEQVKLQLNGKVSNSQ